MMLQHALYCVIVSGVYENESELTQSKKNFRNVLSIYVITSYQGGHFLHLLFICQQNS